MKPRFRLMVLHSFLRRALLGMVASIVPMLAWGQVTPLDTKEPNPPPAGALSQKPIQQPAPADGGPRKWSLHFQQTFIKQ